MRLQEEVDLEDQLEEQVFLDTRKFNPETNRVDLSQQSCTDIKMSRRVVFPPGRTSKEEATLEVRTNLWKEVLDK